MHGRSTDTSLAKICSSMSELFDKEVNAQKNFWGSRKLPQAHEKVRDENESRNRRKMMDA